MTKQNQTTTITTTVSDLEKAWGSTREEWGLMGSVEIADDEEIRFAEREDEGYVLERYEDGEWYVASDERFEASDLPTTDLDAAIEQALTDAGLTGFRFETVTTGDGLTTVRQGYSEEYDYGIAQITDLTTGAVTYAIDRAEDGDVVSSGHEGIEDLDDAVTLLKRTIEG